MKFKEIILRIMAIGLKSAGKTNLTINGVTLENYDDVDFHNINVMAEDLIS